MTQIIETVEVCTMAELINALDRISHNALHQIHDDCVAIEGAPLKMIVEVETLTDSSEVYNLRFVQA